MFINCVRGLLPFSSIAGLLATLIVPQTALAQQFTPACGQAPRSAAIGFELQLRASATCNNLFLQDDLDSENVASLFSWQNLTWMQDPADLTPWGRVANLATVISGHTITLQTLTIEDLELTIEQNDFEFFGTNIGLTMKGGTINLDNNPIWKAGQNLTISSAPGVQDPGRPNIIQSLGGQQAPTTHFSVPAGASLQQFGNGTLGVSVPDNDRLNFIASNNSADIQGVWDIYRSHILFPTGSNEVLISNGGELLISGSNRSTLDTGNVTVTNGKVTQPDGENYLIAHTLTLDGATVAIGDAATTVLSSGLDATGSPSTITVGNNAGNFGSQLSTPIMIVAAPLTLNGEGRVITPWVNQFSGGSFSVGGGLTLEITSGAASASNSWTSASVSIGTDARLLINAGATVFTNQLATHDGLIQVNGALQIAGTTAGGGAINVLSGGQLGPLGNNGGDTFTSSPAVFIDDGATFEVLLEPTAGQSQRLNAAGDFKLGAGGVALNPSILSGTDTVLPDGTKFTIVDYPDGNILGGYFTLGGAQINEGDQIIRGANKYLFSYADGSAITMTVVGHDTLPDPTYPVLFNVTGFAGTTPVEVLLNGGDPITASSDGSFSFHNHLADGASYSVTIGTQPDGQTCSVTNGSGTMAGAPVTDPLVTCVDDPVDPPSAAPKPVPVMPLWLLGLMAAAMAGLGAARIRFRR